MWVPVSAIVRNGALRRIDGAVFVLMGKCGDDHSKAKQEAPRREKEFRSRFVGCLYAKEKANNKRIRD